MFRQTIAYSSTIQILYSRKNITASFKMNMDNKLACVKTAVLHKMCCAHGVCYKCYVQYNYTPYHVRLTSSSCVCVYIFACYLFYSQL